MENVIKLPKSSVVFDRESHTYTKDGKELSGVTPIVHWLFPETYAGIPQFVMEAAADYGHMIHSACQMSDVVGIAEHESVIAYQELKQACGLTTIANEYLISNDEIASSIDVVCSEDGKDGDALIDIKTTSRVHHDHLSAQLSIYAWLYEAQTRRKVGNLYCCWLPKKRYGETAMIPVKRIPILVCEFIVRQYLAGETNDESRVMLQDCGIYSEDVMPQLVTEQIPVQYSDVVDEVISIETELKTLKEREKTLKDGLLALMRENGVKKWEGDGLTMTYVAETTRKAVDSTKLKKEYPEVYEACMRESKVSDSIKITIN